MGSDEEPVTGSADTVVAASKTDMTIHGMLERTPGMNRMSNPFSRRMTAHANKRE